MANTDDILAQMQNYFNKGIGFTNQILANTYVQKLRRFLPKPVKIIFALRNAYEKNGLEHGIEDIAQDLFNKTLLLGEFIKAYYKGDYREISTVKFALIITAIVYIASPLDLIPSWIAFIGVFDDIILILWLLENLNEELDKFADWKARQAVVVSM